MPNWVEQNLHVVGSKGDIDRFIETGWNEIEEQRRIRLAVVGFFVVVIGLVAWAGSAWGSMMRVAGRSSSGST